MKTTQTSAALLTLGLLTLGMNGAQAQIARRAGMRKTRMAQAGQMGKSSGLLQQLNLTPAQKEQIAGIEMTEKGQITAIKQNTALSPADKATQEKAAHKAGRAKLLAVLTPDQKAQLKQLIAQRRQQKGQTATGTPTGTPTGTSTGNPLSAPPATGTPAATTGKGTSPVTPPAGKGTTSDDDLGDLEDLT